MAIGVTAAGVRVAPLPPSPPAREAVEFVVAPAAVPVTPPLPNETSPVAPSVVRPPRPSPGQVAPGVPATPRTARDSGGANRPGPRDQRTAEALRRGVGSIAAPGAVARLCALTGTPTRADSTRLALAGCPPPTAEELRRAGSATGLANDVALATALQRKLALTQAERDSLAREAAIGAKRAGAAGAGGAGASINIGLPGGGPSNASRKRDRILDADVSARLKRIREQGEARMKARADSLARADSVRRAGP